MNTNKAIVVLLLLLILLLGGCTTESEHAYVYVIVCYDGDTVIMDTTADGWEYYSDSYIKILYDDAPDMTLVGDFTCVVMPRPRGD